VLAAQQLSQHPPAQLAPSRGAPSRGGGAAKPWCNIRPDESPLSSQALRERHLLLSAASFQSTLLLFVPNDGMSRGISRGWTELYTYERGWTKLHTRRVNAARALALARIRADDRQALASMRQQMSAFAQKQAHERFQREALIKVGCSKIRVKNITTCRVTPPYQYDQVGQTSSDRFLLVTDRL